MEDHVVSGAGTDSRNQVSLRKLFPKSKLFGGDDCVVQRVVGDAEEVLPGDVLAILPGCDDPLAAGCQALARGAAAILTEQLLPIPLFQCIVPDTARAAAKICDTLYAHPSDSLLMIGVVGADGKTTTALLAAAVLRGAGHRTAYETDLGACDGVIQNTGVMRSDSLVAIHEFLADARDAGSRAAVVELSPSLIRSPAFRHLAFDVLVLTGAAKGSRDTDFNAQTMDLALDRLRDGGAAIVNGDSPAALAAADRAGVPLLTYALRNDANVSAKVFEQLPGQTTLMVTAGDTTAVMETHLTGPCMASNQLAAIALGLLLEIPLHRSIAAITEVRTVPGRMQRIAGFEGPSVVLDAASNPARFSNTLRSLRRERCGGKLWVVAVVGQNGNACDLAACGHLGERFADHVVVTSASAGKEHFLSSAHDWLDGVERTAAPRLIADREAAVRWVMEQASPNDTILVAGRWPSGSPAAQRAEIEGMIRLVDQARDHVREAEPQVFAHPAMFKAAS